MISCIFLFFCVTLFMGLTQGEAILFNWFLFSLKMFFRILCRFAFLDEKIINVILGVEKNLVNN